MARPSVRPDALLTVFRELQEAAPALRLVLSGRNDLRDPRTGVITQFPDAVTVPVELLSPDDRRRYLTETRGLSDPALVRAIVRKSGGVPFTLALFGDLARGPNPPTAENVEQASGPALLHCLERVLERIPDDQVRWLLRYGAVPRTLCLDFVLNVMWRPLVEGIGGTSAVDRPELDRRPPDRPVQIWLTDGRPPADEAAVRALWDQLVAYASGSSWINFSDREPDALMIHPIVRRPLRELLGAQEVYRQLHAAALAYYRRRAQAEPGRRVRWLSHALYHQCYLDPEAAVEDWRVAVAAARESGQPDAVPVLVNDLFADAAADTPLAGDPYLAGSEPDVVVPPRIRYEASVEVASAAVVAARARAATGSHHLWSIVESELAEAGQVLAAHPELRCRPLHRRRCGCASPCTGWPCVPVQRRRGTRCWSPGTFPTWPARPPSWPPSAGWTGARISAPRCRLCAGC